ncbi:ExeA family protein [Candidatus Omnitrophota bacterium]
MSYYGVLGFEKEPFSTSPDPDFFYLSRAHETALTNTLIELRLKRGLSVVLGDVGMGKTTLSRKLIQELKERDDFIFHMILDPSFESENVFVRYLLRNFDAAPADDTEAASLALKEALERFLFQKGISENRTVTLIVDEAQKLSDASLELLRVLLNYETNEFKLLQLVLLGQMELHAKIMNIPNFFDRISFKYTLNPLNYEETKEMIEFRLRQAGYRSRIHLFLDEAVREIHTFARGYPRQVTMLCHKSLKALVLKNRSVVSGALVEELVQEEIRTGWHRRDPILLKNSY